MLARKTVVCFVQSVGVLVGRSVGQSVGRPAGWFCRVVEMGYMHQGSAAELYPVNWLHSF